MTKGLRKAFVRGLTILLSLIVTLLVISIVLGVIANAEYVDGSEIRRTGTGSIVSASRSDDKRTESPSGESNNGEP
jgi:competence protein ComGC